MLDLGLMEAFADVADLGSFTAAARRRGVTQPAISMQVRELERRLGVRLIERAGRTVAPTGAGRDLLVHVRAIRAELDRALVSLAPHRSGDRGRARIGTGATACIYLLPPVLRRLRERMPGLELVVQTGNTPDLMRMLAENEIDIGFVTLPVRGRAFAVEPLVDDDLVAVEASGRGPDGPATADALSRAPLVLYEPGGNTRVLIDDWFAAAGATPRPLMQLGSVEAIKELAAAGLGAAILPATAVTAAGARPDLRVRPLAPPLRRTLGIVMRSDKTLDRGLRETLHALRSLAA